MADPRALRSATLRAGPGPPKSTGKSSGALVGARGRPGRPTTSLFSAPLPMTPLPVVPSPPPDTFVFQEEKNPLGRVVAEMAQLRPVTAFQASRMYQYDAAQHGALQTVVDSLQPFALLKLPQGDYRVDLHLRKPIYVQADGAVRIFGAGGEHSVRCDGELIVIDGLVVSAPGGVCVSSGYASLLNCRIASTSFSAVLVCGEATADLYQCDLSGSSNPALHIAESAVARVTKTEIHDAKGYGVLVDSGGQLAIGNCKVHTNAVAGIVAADRAHLRVTQCEVTKNGDSGLVLSSSGHLKIEGAAIADHPRGSGIVVVGQAAAAVSKSDIRQSGFGGVRVVDGGVVRSQGNVYADGADGSLIVACDRGFVSSQSDSFQNAAAAAVAVFAGGRLHVRGAKMEGFAGGGALCYGGGKLVMEEVTMAKLPTFGVQVRDDSVLEMRNVHVSQVAGPCIAVTGAARGFARGCTFGQSASVGGEFADAGSWFDVTNCDFVQNSVAGLIVRDATNITFSNCKFNANGQVGVDVAGSGCAPVFRGCQFLKNEVIGIAVTDGASPRVVKGTISGSAHIGALVSGAVLSADNVDVSACGEAAVAVFDRGQVVVCASKVHDNANFGCQVSSKGASARFVTSIFAGHAGSIFALDNAVAQCENCKFEGAVQVHCEVREGAIAHFDGCEVQAAASGIGLQVHDAATLQLDTVKVQGQAKFGIVVGNGTCKAFNSVVSDCAAGGVYAQEGATVELEKCKLEKNGEVGIQAQGGVVKITECGISGHGYGVVVQPAAEFTELSTKYEANEKKDRYP